jgi:hypothetical protein
VGEKDDDVPLKGNYDQFLNQTKGNKLVNIYLSKGHRHNPYLSNRAENYVIDTILQGTVKMAKETNLEKKEEFFPSQRASRKACVNFGTTSKASPTIP